MLLLLVCCSAHAESGSVLVTTTDARQGTLPDIVTAYGSASPALDTGSAISLPQDGRVLTIYVTQGERVHTGGRLLTFELSAAAQSSYSQALNAFSLAEAERGHTAQLLAQHLATRDQLAQAEKAMADAHSALQALVRQGADHPRTEVTSPFEAVVDSIQAAQGARLLAGAPLITLSRVDNLVVTAGIDPALLPRLRPDSPVRLRKLGEAGEAQAGFDGKVVRIDDVLNPRTRLVDVDIAVPQGSVILGEFFRADFTLGQLKGWIVPHAAVLEDEKGFYLFQLRSEGTGKRAHRVAVRELGVRGGSDAVDGNLDAGDQVIVEGATQLADGDAVRTAP